MKRRTNPNRDRDERDDEEKKAPIAASEGTSLAGLGGDSSLTGTPMEDLGEPGQQIVDHRSPMEDFIEKYKYLLLLGLILVLAGAILFFLIRHFNEKKATAAAMAYTSAETIDDFDLVIQEHGGSVAAGNAYLRRAQLMVDADRKSEAFSVLRKFVEQYSEHPRHAQGLLALATFEESEEKLDSAQEIYQMVIDQHPTSELAPYAYLRQGDLLLRKGDKEGARKIYEDINPRFPRTGQIVIGKVENRMQLLGIEEKTHVDPNAEGSPPAAAEGEAAISAPVEEPAAQE